MKIAKNLTRISLINLALIGGLTASAHADTLLADVRGDFVADSALPLADTNGNGTWNYLGSVNGDLSASKTQLAWTTAGADTQAFYGGADTSTGYNLPAVSETKIFNDGATPSFGQVAWHPGNTHSADIEWTAGAGETGLLTLSGEISKVGENLVDIPPSGAGVVDFSIYVDNVLTFSATGVGPGEFEAFSFNFNSAVGTKVDLVLSGDPSGTFAYDESLLSAQITTVAVPEPSAWAMMLGGLVVLGGLMRRRMA